MGGAPAIDPPAAMYASKSACLILPAGPEPLTVERSTSFSLARFRTAGLARTLPVELCDGAFGVGALEQGQKLVQELGPVPGAGAGSGVGAGAGAGAAAGSGSVSAPSSPPTGTPPSLSMTSPVLISSRVVPTAIMSPTPPLRRVFYNPACWGRNCNGGLVGHYIHDRVVFGY